MADKNDPFKPDRVAPAPDRSEGDMRSQVGMRPLGPDRPEAPNLGGIDAGPIPEVRRSRLLSEDISKKQGNYIFTFGFPGSGKTTFHSFLIRYLMQVGPFKTEPLSRTHNGDTDYDAMRVVTKWMSEWQEGRFPEPTPIGEDEIRELTFEVQPLQGIRTPLEFTFLEVSGEMLQTVMPTEYQDPALSRVIRQLLENRNINLIMFLLLNPEVHNNDALFFNFMNYMDKNLGFDIRERTSLGIIVSKPEEALSTLKRLRSGFEAVAEIRGDYTEDFIEAFAPSTYRIWYDWPNPKKKMLARIYIGEIKRDGQKPRLIRPDFGSVERIFAWMYFQFTGRKLGPTLWQRMIRWIKS